MSWKRVILIAYLSIALSESQTGVHNRRIVELPPNATLLNVINQLDSLTREHQIRRPDRDGSDVTVEENLIGDIDTRRHFPPLTSQSAGSVVPINYSVTIDEIDTRRRARARLVQNLLANHRQKEEDIPEGSVRLEGGQWESEGNVQVYHMGKWGGICDDEWDMKEADIVCKQLNYEKAEEAYGNSVFGVGIDQIWMDNLVCYGQEENLTDCRFDGWGIHDCNPSEAAGVRCAVPTTEVPSTSTTTPSPNVTRRTRKVKKQMQSILEVRIIGGRVPEEGRLEIKTEKKGWGTVCGDGWNLLSASVACRQAGYKYASNAVITDYFGGNGTTMLASYISCHGTEQTLNNCQYNLVDTIHCPGYEGFVAGVVCADIMADLIPDHIELQRTAHLEDRQLFFLQCAMEENCLSSSAYKLSSENSYGWHLTTRRLLRFTARIANIGDADFRPILPKFQWQWHQCHLHYHSMEAFAHFDVIDMSGKKVAEGHKASFCLEDNECKPGVEPEYDCSNFGDQGISPGCTDTYAYNVDCQWIDMTDVKPGDYIFKASINAEFKVAEQTFENNAAVCNLMYTEVFAHIWNCTLGRP